MNGIFISFEGCEGAGKSTQATLLYEHLKKSGKKVLHLREPGGTVIGEEIRNIILDKDNINMLANTEALLYAASRAQIIGEIIKPHLEEGYIIVCDRFIDSSYAYQGYGRGLGLETVREINSYAINNIMPNITFYIKLDPEIGLYRNQQEDKDDRFEDEELSFHRKVFQGFNEIADIYSDRIITIDGNLKIEEIQNIIIEKVNKIISKTEMEEEK